MSTDEEHNQNREGLGEEEPLLGEQGDAQQQEGKPLYYNFILGTGVVAQAGAWILAAIVWGSVFSHELILFSVHPLLNSAAILLFTQGVLVVQPTHTKEQKRKGTWTHAGLNNVALLTAIAGLVVIEYNKIAHNGTHFVSPHAILGLISYILLLIQTIVGFTQYFVPQLYGGEEKAKKLYKYHRVFGYIIFILLLSTVAAATETDFNKNVLGIQLWAVIAASIITLVGVVPRIRLAKFGYLAGH
ncbi:eukaryotic cytochrome b561-domain-containing protein [Delphinella strobiligena]|nr:eukaryotic cytochrome b561-domain-containing protein [Delphinella strobiligena]